MNLPCFNAPTSANYLLGRAFNIYPPLLKLYKYVKFRKNLFLEIQALFLEMGRL
jgi:hypothetical protein